MQRRRIMGRGTAIRLVGAFVVGLLLGFLASKLGAGVQNLLPLLLFPLFIGIAGALITGAQQRHPHLVALGRGLAAWLGVSIYLLAFAGHQSGATCTAGNCGSANVLASLLFLYVLAGLIPIALGSLVTSALARYFSRPRPKAF